MLKILVFLIVVLLISGETLRAQWTVTGYSEIGDNNISEGVYLKMAPMLAYKIKNTGVDAALQSDVKSGSPNVVSGFRLAVAQNFNLSNRQFKAEAFYMKTLPTDLLRETNRGVLLSTLKGHFDIKAGTNLRAIAISKQAVEDYQLTGNAVLKQKLNLMYHLSYDLRAGKVPWNVGATWTNFDHFFIFQETNPILNIHGYYNLRPQMRFFAEVWYKTAGAINLNVNYFGSSLRTGVIWSL